MGKESSGGLPSDGLDGVHAVTWGLGPASLRREHAFRDQPFAEFDAEGVVDAEQGDGDAADRRAADEDHSLPAEVPRPFVAAGVEERCELACLRIRLLISDPLKELQYKQLKQRLLATVGPLCLPAMMWSISKGSSSAAWGIWQYSQRPLARCQTSRESTASIAASGSGLGFEFDAERAAGLGFEDGEHRTGLGEGEQLFLLGGRQGVLLIPHGQVVHPGLVAVAEAEVQDVPGHLGGELAAFVAEDASEDRHLVFAGMS